MARLQQQLRQTLAANGISERELAQKVHEVEAGWEQRLQEVQQQAQERQQELSDRCQLALIEKAAHERAAHDAASKQQAAEERGRRERRSHLEGMRRLRGTTRGLAQP